MRDPLLKKVIEVADDQNSTFGLNLIADFIPILKYVPTTTERKLKEGNTFIKRYLTEVMDEHRKNFDPGDLHFATSKLKEDLSGYKCILIYDHSSLGECTPFL